MIETRGRPRSKISEDFVAYISQRYPPIKEMIYVMPKSSKTQRQKNIKAIRNSTSLKNFKKHTGLSVTIRQLDNTLWVYFIDPKDSK